jgi:hypothetical protein
LRGAFGAFGGDPLPLSAPNSWLTDSEALNANLLRCPNKDDENVLIADLRQVEAMQLSICFTASSSLAMAGYPHAHFCARLNQLLKVAVDVNGPVDRNRPFTPLAA